MVTEAVSPLARKSKSLPGLKVISFPISETEAVEMEMAFPLSSCVAEAMAAELAWRLRTSVLSGSVSLAMTSTVTEEFSVVAPESMTAVGPSLVPVMVTTTSWLSVPPFASFTVMVNVAVTSSPAARKSRSPSLTV